jgi:hypothetical protein
MSSRVVEKRYLTRKDGGLDCVGRRGMLAVWKVGGEE